MRRNGHLHPSRARLAAWLNGDEPQLDRHIESCHRCAGRLEKLDSQGPEAIADVLRQRLAPAAGLAPRLHDGINNKMRARGDLSLVGDLLALPIETARVLTAGGGIDG